MATAFHPKMPMSELILPAPLWRRVAASIYDGLLLLGIWMTTILLVELPLTALGVPLPSAGLQALMFVVGFVFFGWFWTHGGQTLGMRAWKLQLRRDNGDAVRPPIAVLRYAAMLIYWGVVLTPVAAWIILRTPKFAPHFPRAADAAIAAVTATLITIALRLVDARRRLPHDWLTGTEVVALPSNPRVSEPAASASPQSSAAPSSANPPQSGPAKRKGRRR